MRHSPKSRLQELAGVIHLARETGLLALALMVSTHGGPLRVEVKGKIIEVSARQVEQAHAASGSGHG